MVLFARGGSVTIFAYDANGQRVKTVQPGGITTYFPFDVAQGRLFPGYEETVNETNTIKRSTYALAGQRIALRVSGDLVSGNNGLFYVLSDHLGSTSVLSNSRGSLVAGSTSRYLPFGGHRTTPTQTITDRDFTGHAYHNLATNDIGLIYMGARFYVPSIARFTSPDIFVMDPNRPASLNRYAHVGNKPLVYNGPDEYC